MEAQIITAVAIGCIAIGFIAGVLIGTHREHQRRLEPLRDYNRKRHQTKLARQAAAKAKREALHQEMRDQVRGII